MPNFDAIKHSCDLTNVESLTCLLLNQESDSFLKLQSVAIYPASGLI